MIEEAENETERQRAYMMDVYKDKVIYGTQKEKKTTKQHERSHPPKIRIKL